MGRSINDITEAIIASAIPVHRELGPGLLESAYEACLAFEWSQRSIAFERQYPLPLRYKGESIDCGYRLGFLVEKSVVVELKSVERLEPIHQAQMLSYLRLSGCTVGLLINFNVRVLKDGIQRSVLGYTE